MGLRLFAEIGYDDVSVRMIADAAGVDLETFQALGGKSGIYRTIMDNFLQKQNDLLDEVQRGGAPGSERIQRSLIRFVEFDLEHPYELAVWQYRGLNDAADLAEIEERYWNPIYRRIAGILGARVMRPPLI